MADQYAPKTELKRKIFPSGLEVTLDSPKLTIGVSGRVYESERKGDQSIKDVDNEMKGDIEWKFMGSGWNELDLQNEYTQQDWESDDSAKKFYEGIDVLLCLATLEGGPVPNLEAVKCGVPVVSTKVGNVEEWGKLSYVVNSPKEAIKELQMLAERKKIRYTLCQKNWDWFAEEHRTFFEEILKVSK